MFPGVVAFLKDAFAKMGGTELDRAAFWHEHCSLPEYRGLIVYDTVQDAEGRYSLKVFNQARDRD